MKRKKIHTAARKALLIVTSTESESLYFSQMRKDCRYTNLTVLWASEAKDVEDLIKIAAKERLRGRFDSVWLTLSLQVLNITPTHIKEMNAFASKKKVKLAWNNPDISLWYLLHLQAPRLPITDMAVIEASLKGVFPDFTTDPSYLLDQGSSLHLKLFGNKAQAVVNASTYNNIAASRLGNMDPVNMTKLLNDITLYCGNADITHNQKMIGMKNN